MDEPAEGPDIDAGSVRNVASGPHAPMQKPKEFRSLVYHRSALGLEFSSTPSLCDSEFTELNPQW